MDGAHMEKACSERLVWPHWPAPGLLTLHVALLLFLQLQLSLVCYGESAQATTSTAPSKKNCRAWVWGQAGRANL